MTLRAHYESYRERNGTEHPSFAAAPKLPPSCVMLWNDFMELHRRRGDGGITFLEIDAYERVHGLKFEAWEIDAITRADHAYLASRPRGGGNG